MRITIECRPEELKDYAVLLSDLTEAFHRQGFKTIGIDTPTRAEILGIKYQIIWTPDESLSDVDIQDRLEDAPDQLSVMCSADPSMWDLMAFERIAG